MDYGHPLQFGAAIDASSADPAAVVDAARHAEAIGLDLVTVADHPYQSAQLETWTVLSWIAGSTDRIRIAPNVLNTAIRPPAVLARAAASLDLLSGGRLDLGLGAGHYWDAMAAMGAERRSPGEAVDALAETIEVLRAIWSAEPTLDLPGRFHTLTGAQGGPAPAHAIPLWIGALRPRMQRLIGATADGWWPSLGRLGPGDLAAGNAVIDAAAVEVGRDPREIRRLLNITGSTAAGGLGGSPSTWVERLLPYILDDGVGTFVLAGADRALLESFAAEVAPALREAVAAERAARSTPVGAVVPLAVRAKRREGIDYDAVPPSLAATAIEPGHAGYAGVRNTYLRGGAPGLVLRPGSADEVAQALAFARSQFARSQPVPLAVRSAGHGISGRSTNDGGIVIDLSRLNRIDVLDPGSRLVRIEPGARWGEVAAALHLHGWALSSGDFGGVGVGGLATAGGIGWLGREHGLTIDHLRAVEMVLADGALVRADTEHHPELFWAVRGAGANFGIVTGFEFEVDEVGDVGFAQLVFDAGDVAEFLQRWGVLQEAAPRDLTSFLIIGRPRGGQLLATVLATVDSDDPDTVISRLQPFATLGPLLQQAVQILPYPAIVSTPDGGQHGQGEPATRSALVEHLTPELAAAASRLIHSGASYFFQIRSVGGAVADVPPEATAYAHRSANFSVIAFGAGRTRLDAVWDTQIQPHANGLYLSFETDPRPERITDAFPPATLARLRELKGRLDPENVFRDNFNVAPAVRGVPVG